MAVVSADPLQEFDPRRLGRYRVLARLGIGGMGTVFLAEDGAGRRVAIKAMRPDLVADDGVRRRFAREVRAAQRVTGPGVARVLDADPAADPPYLVLDLVDGPTLAEHVHRSGPFGPTATHALAVALARALVSIHDAGIAHRDLKPANVLLPDSGPVVVDFGVAAATDLTSITGAGTVMGSPGWMAPEQAQGREPTPAIDVFTWGLVVSFAATGRHPFGADRADSVAYRIVHEEPDLEGVPEEVRPTVAASLRRDPPARPAAEDLVTLLLGLAPATPAAGVEDATREVLGPQWADRADSSTVVVAPPPPPAGPTAPPAPPPATPARAAPANGRSRRIVTALLVITAAAVVGAIVALVLRDRLDRTDAVSPADAAAGPPSTTTVPMRTITVIWTVQDNLDRTVGSACEADPPRDATAEITVTEAATGDRLIEPVAVGSGTARPGDPLVPFVDPPAEGETGDSFCVYERPFEAPLVAAYRIEVGDQSTEVDAATLDQTGGRVELTTDAGLLSGLLD